MSQYLDLINLMTYDLHGAWEDRTGCNAPLYTGFNAPASGACAKGPSTGEAGYRAYYEIKAEIAAGASKFYDEERQCPYILSGQEWVGYDDIRSICAKVQFAQSRNLAGSMLWALDLDDFAGAYSDKAYPLTSIA